MVNYEKIKKECFWEYNFSEKDIKEMASSDDMQKKRFLFNKILLNSTTLFNDLKIFSKEDLAVLITEYKVPTFNYDYIFKRINMAEVYFLDKPLLVDELQWVA
jgi:hypothetical protein